MDLKHAYRVLVQWGHQNAVSRRGLGLGQLEEDAEWQIKSASLADLLAAGIPREWAEQEKARHTHETD